MTKRAWRTIVDGLVFPEGPRWRDGLLWFSDQHAGAVLAVTIDGTVRETVPVPGGPSGLGWLPDGRMLVVSMHEQRVLRRDGERLVEHADLGPFAKHECNDMVVDASGRAYVGNFGFDLNAGAMPETTVLVAVEPDGSPRAVADELMFPNGMVITPDARTLIVAETMGRRLTAFDVAPDGSLSGRRVFAELPRGAVPDGICLDAEGAVWAASPTSREVLRIAEGGEVLDRVPTGEHGAYACMLGGEDRRTLFVCTAETFLPQETVALRSGQVRALTVDVPGAGLP